MANKKQILMLSVFVLGVCMLIGMQLILPQPNVLFSLPNEISQPMLAKKKVVSQPRFEQRTKLIAGQTHRVERYEKAENLPESIATLLGLQSENSRAFTQPQHAQTPEEAILQSNLPDDFKSMLLNYTLESHVVQELHSELDNQPEHIKQLLLAAQFGNYPTELASRHQQNVNLAQLDMPEDIRALVGQINAPLERFTAAQENKFDQVQAMRNALPDQLHFLIEGN